ncbi:hypothetical protein RvY_06780 [Ramazzottius varieornatus]|uniref:Uncharacterized protein n=1 Tax=Ramazzottius varieornatus TaxID=947166 RepID=A0A1D1UZQ0_RAMVA|nr:hypothetical protein RvY_06780 [Ramazzottius varieornatus]
MSNADFSCLGGDNFAGESGEFCAEGTFGRRADLQNGIPHSCATTKLKHWTNLQLETSGTTGYPQTVKRA